MRRRTIARSLSAWGLLIGLAIPLASFARPPGPGGEGFGHRGHHRGPDPERFIERHAEELGLSAETREAILKIVEESRARSEKIRADLRDGHEALHELLNQDMPDESDVMDKVEAINALKLAAHKNRLKAMIAIRSQLTPEQRAELARIRDEAMPWRKRWGFRKCRDDVAELCPEAEPGRAILECLSTNWEALSEECRGAFESGRDSGFRPGPRFGWWRY